MKKLNDQVNLLPCQLVSQLETPHDSDRLLQCPDGSIMKIGGRPCHISPEGNFEKIFLLVIFGYMKSPLFITIFIPAQDAELLIHPAASPCPVVAGDTAFLDHQFKTFLLCG